PWGTLLDQDYISVSDGATSDTIEFSHTDSHTTLGMVSVEAAARLRISAVHLVAGFRYESSVYDAYGGSGWQLDPMANQVAVSIPADLHALRYEVLYRIPFIGVGVSAQAKRMMITGEAR